MSAQLAEKALFGPAFSGGIKPQCITCRPVSHRDRHCHGTTGWLNREISAVMISCMRVQNYLYGNKVFFLIETIFVKNNILFFGWVPFSCCNGSP